MSCDIISYVVLLLCEWKFKMLKRKIIKVYTIHHPLKPSREMKVDFLLKLIMGAMKRKIRP